MIRRQNNVGQGTKLEPVEEEKGISQLNSSSAISVDKSLMVQSLGDDATEHEPPSIL